MIIVKKELIEKLVVDETMELLMFFLTANG